MDRKDPIESHKPRGAPREICGNVFCFYPCGPPECTERHRTNPTNPGGPRVFVKKKYLTLYFCFYPWGPPEWIEKTRLNRTNPGGPPDRFVAMFFVFTPCDHRNEPPTNPWAPLRKFTLGITGMHRKDPNEFHKPRGPQETFGKYLKKYFSPWGPAEYTEQH